jgi:hypothetical protein
MQPGFTRYRQVQSRAVRDDKVKSHAARDNKEQSIQSQAVTYTKSCHIRLGTTRYTHM